MTRTVCGRAGLVVPVVLLALVAGAGAGCTGRSDDNAATEGTEASGGAGEAADEASADTTSAEDGGGGGDAAVPLAVDTVAVAQAREVVRTGTMELTVEDVDATAADVRAWPQATVGSSPTSRCGHATRKPT
jgi:hypothetical protein